ncbi:MAG: hypothetical protein DSY46_06870 [Hydrogenimonas sp.]|nr:MAG: hypothetical protein DSY46_06870 [Hydrogenimonas sp.]
MAIFSLLISQGYGETKIAYDGYIDHLHQLLSHKVIDWFDRTDSQLNTWLGGESNETLPVKSKEERLHNERTVIDTFFQSGKYLDETDETYIRIRFDTQFQTLDSNRFDVSLSAHLPLLRSRKRINLFLEDFNEENAKNVLSDPSTKESTPSIGLNYFAPEAFGIGAKYSVGLHGLNPYIQARYNRIFKVENWLIEPVQTFEYSKSYRFEEATTLYLDTQPLEYTLLRFQLYRKTESTQEGMDYALRTSYFYTKSRKTQWRIAQTFWGNTRYRFLEPSGLKSNVYSGISDYQTEISLRRNLWRKWFFCEVVPSVNFHRQYNYRPNYALRLYLDFYFGHYRW